MTNHTTKWKSYKLHYAVIVKQYPQDTLFIELVFEDGTHHYNEAPTSQLLNILDIYVTEMKKVCECNRGTNWYYVFLHPDITPNTRLFPDVSYEWRKSGD